MDVLIKKQKSVSELLVNFLTNTKKSAGKANYTKGYVQGRLELLEKYWVKFEVCHDDIVAEQDADADEISKEYFKSHTYSKAESSYSDAFGFLNDELIRLDPQPGPSSTRQHGSTVQSASQRNSQQDIKLQRISIPVFTGDLKEWTSFHDLFEALVLKNTALSDVQKLHHLKSSISGDAQSLLRQFAVQGNNFEAAWTLLKKRFANKKLLIHSEMDRLLSMPKANTFNTESIRRVLDTSNECLTAISNLVAAENRYDTLVLHILTQKLDNKTLEAWELSIRGSEEPASLEDLSNFLEEYCRTMLLVNSTKKIIEFQPKTEKLPSKKQISHSYHASDNSNQRSCSFCHHSSHAVYHCFKFKKLSVADRKQFVDSKGMCTRCLSAAHMVAQCSSSYSCIKCRKPHHLLLHDSTIVTPASPSSSNIVSVETPQTLTDAPILHSHHSQQGHVRRTLLATALISVQSSVGEPVVLRALLDQGSEASLITKSAAALLKLNLTKTSVVVKGIGSSVAGKSSHIARFTISSIYNTDFKINVDAIVMQNLTSLIPSSLVPTDTWHHIQNLQLADPTFCKPSKIDVLLGADIYGELITDGIKRGEVGAPIAQATKLGWILSGKIRSSSSHLSSNLPTTVTSCHSELDVCQALRKFWEIEEVSVDRRFSSEEALCEQHFHDTYSRLDNGSYEVCLPFKGQSIPTFGDSRSQALSRLNQVERRLKSNPQLQLQYNEFMKEYLLLGHMRPVVDNSSSGNFYLPHHAVVKPSSSSTKVRVVFDASAKSANGLSLNETLLIGPTIQQDMFSILLRWRKYRIALTGDVEKMYRQIFVTKQHQPYQRILWRNENNALQDFELTTVTYGTACAPFLAIRTLKQLAQDEQSTFPTAAARTLQDMYVDDFISGGDTVDETIRLHHEMSQMFGTANLNLRKWASNSKEVLNAIPLIHQETNDALNVCKNEILKTLGMYWNTRQDNFQFKITLPAESSTLSKRNFLSDIAKLFDPLGLLAPVTIAAKILFQSLWLKGLDWDETLPDDVSSEWLLLRNALPCLTNISIPRWIGTSAHSHIQLHGFCDASNKAYSAVVYCRSTTSTGVHIAILTAKTRVAPIKRISLPNLELCGATLLAKLLSKTQEAMSFGTLSVYAWTDSTIVLDWLRNNTHKQTFVANRISTILDHLKPEQWNHVKSNDNPADVASRGICPSQLQRHELWWNGPSWLQLSPTLWPKYISTSKHKNTDTSILTTNTTTEHKFSVVFQNYSSLTKAVRVIAFCIRFATNCKIRKINQHAVDNLSADELNISLNRILHCVQREVYGDEINGIKRSGSKSSNLITLSPFVCPEGFLRVGGRLHNANISFNQKHPIILPRDSHVTSLLIHRIHLSTLHGGNNLVLSTLRTQYWVPGARSLIRSIIHKCIVCHRFAAKCKNQIMSNLPSSRVTPSKIFAHTGVDYAGPVDIRLSKHRGKGTFKGYVVVFVCMSTKAIHLELASDLSSPTFIAAFKRFVSRRGLCSDIYSDNGTNFVGASKDLDENRKQLLSQINKDVSDEFAIQGTKWHFIPPSTPHFGGLWEAGVKAMKFHLKRVIGQTVLTFEEFYTLLTQIEASLNSRPISPMSADPNDFNALTPGHFITGGPINVIPEPSLLHITENRLQRWQLIQKIYQDFWKAWSLNYLNELQQRPKKWSKSHDNMQVGQMVIIKDDRYPPSTWRLARIIAVHPGQDGVVRVVTVKHKSGTFKRPTSKLCLLPIDNLENTSK